MTQHPISDFPTRPIKVLRSGAPSSTISYVLAAFAFALAIFVVWLQGPGILHDMQIRKAPLVMEDAMMRNAKCTVRKGIFYECSANVSYQVAGKRFQQSLSLSFITFHSGDWTTNIVRSETNPALVTLGIGLDMFWNRAAVLVGGAFLILAGGVALVLLGRKNAATKSMEGKLALLTAIKAKIKSEKKAYGKTIISFSCYINGKNRDFTSAFKKGEMPLYINADESEALAVVPANTAIPLLMDSALERIDLTQEERNQLLP